MDGKLIRADGTWDGDVIATLPAKASGAPMVFVWKAVTDGGAPAMELQPVEMRIGQLTLTGVVRESGYQLELAGSATPAQLAEVSVAIPPLGDGVVTAVASDEDAADSVDVTCQRMWGQAQKCAVNARQPVKILGRQRR